MGWLRWAKKKLYLDHLKDEEDFYVRKKQDLVKSSLEGGEGGDSSWS